MAKQKASVTSGAEGFPRAQSRRWVLSILPATLFAHWLAMGRRSRVGSTAPKARTDNPAHAPRQPTHEYNRTRGVAEGHAYSFENAGADLVVRDEQGRVVAMQTPLPAGSVRCYLYDAGYE